MSVQQSMQVDVTPSVILNFLKMCYIVQMCHKYSIKRPEISKNKDKAAKILIRKTMKNKAKTDSSCKRRHI